MTSWVNTMAKRCARGRSAWPCGAWLAAMCVCAAGLASGEPATTRPAAEQVERFGAANDALGPLGGGEGYQRLVPDASVSVRTEQQLIDALKKAKTGQVIYVEDGIELDFSAWVLGEKLVLEVPGGVTLAGGRGKPGVEPALLCSDAFATRPLIRAMGPKVRVTGLRIRGPDTKIRHEPLHRWIVEDEKRVGKRERYYAFPTSDGISSAHPGLEVDNCEIWGWGHGAVSLGKGAIDVHIHHNCIHHNQRAALGYGVVLNQAVALIESNIFDYNRHAIAATGRPGTSYEAANNLVRENANGHLFDMHGGRDRKDGTEIAGDWMKIHHNTFQATHVPAFVIRGRPREKVEIHHNWFLLEDQAKAIISRVSPTDFLDVRRNQFGPERKVSE